MEPLSEIVYVSAEKVSLIMAQLVIEEVGIARSFKPFYLTGEALPYLLSCARGSDAASPKASGCPELVIYDTHMPVMDGYEFIEALWKEGYMEHCATIFLNTGHWTGYDQERLKKYGVKGAIRPITEETLVAVYQQYFAGR